MVNLEPTVVKTHLPTMRSYAKLVANCGTKQLYQVKENHLPTMRNYAQLAKSSTYYGNYGKLVANCGAKSSTYYEKLC